MNRATSFANRLQLSIAVIHGDEKTAEADKDDGRTSPPPQRSRIFPVEFNDLPGRNHLKSSSDSFEPA